MQIKPIGERIVVREIEVEKKTESGIIIPDSAAKEAPKYAEIIEISDELLNKDETKDLFKIGDYVIFTPYSGTKVEIDDVNYTVVELEFVQAIVEL